MGFLEKIIQQDKELLIYLNNLGTENWDGFWLIVTNQFSWLPLYTLFLFLIIKAIGLKKGLALIIVVALLVTFSDQLTVFIKNYTHRLRPCSDTTINDMIRIVLKRSSFSFISGHATTSTAISLFMHLTLKKYYKYTILLFIWPIMFAYSRVYLGVHFPLDVSVGALLGLCIGFLFYKLSLKVLSKVPSK